MTRGKVLRHKTNGKYATIVDTKRGYKITLSDLPYVYPYENTIEGFKEYWDSKCQYHLVEQLDDYELINIEFKIIE